MIEICSKTLNNNREITQISSLLNVSESYSLIYSNYLNEC